MENNCEPDQLIKNNLIKPHQFFGVEINPEIYAANKNIKNINWIHGDFYEQMVEYSNNNTFNPAIINADMLLMPKCGVEYLAKIMCLVTSLNIKEVMIVANFILKTRQHVSSKEEIIRRLEKEPMFQAACYNTKWNIYDNCYQYNGTGKTRTKMGSLILSKT